MVSDAVVSLFEKIGNGILVSHSQGGLFSWLSVAKSDKIKAVVAWEAGGYYPFPNDEKQPVTDFDNIKHPVYNFPMLQLVQQYGEYRMVSPQEFERFTKIHIIIIYGDYIPAKPSGNPEIDEWGLRLQLARKWAEAVNRGGGDVTVVHLPEAGFKGNTHFPMSDLNNLEMADLMDKWLKEKGLD